MTGQYSFDPFSADALAGAPDLGAVLAALMPPRKDQPRSASPLAPDVLRSMKDQSRMPEGRQSALPPPESFHFKTPQPAAMASVFAPAQPSQTTARAAPTSQSALPMPIAPASSAPVETQTAAAPVEDDNPFADLIPGAKKSATSTASAAVDEDDPFADLVPGSQPKAQAATGPQASPLYDVLRSAGTGLRSGVEGIPGMVGDVGMLVDKLGEKIARPIFGDEQVDAVLAQRKAETGDTLPTISGMRPPTSADVNKATSSVIGESYKPKTTAGEYARTAGEFLPGSLAGPGSLARKALTFGLIPAAASETAGQATEGTAAEPWARAVAGLGGGLTASAFGPRVPRVPVKGDRADVHAAVERQRFTDPATGKVKPVHLPEAAMPDNPTQTWVAGKLGQVPFLGGPLQASAERTADTMGKRMTELADDLGGGSTSHVRATSGAKDNLTRWIEETSGNRLTAAYDAVDTLITKPKVTTPLTQTRSKVREILDEQDASTGHAADPALALVAEATRRPQGLTYHGLKQLRTEIGDRMSGKITPEPGTSQPALKRLYGALTEDLEASVRKAGGHAAHRAWRDANDLTRNIAREREALTKIVGVKGDASPEAVFNRLLNMASDNKMGSNIEGLRDARHAVIQAAGGNPQAWSDIGAAALARMGRDPTQPADFFSPERFLTSYGKMSKHGRRLLFGPVVAGHVDDLALISQRHRELMRKGNPSGTGGVVTGMGIMTGLMSAPISTIATITTGRGLAMALARPAKAEKLVNWARARNGMLSGASANATQTYLNSTRELAKELAKDEEHGSAVALFQKLIDGGAADPGDHEYR